MGKTQAPRAQTPDEIRTFWWDTVRRGVGPRQRRWRHSRGRRQLTRLRQPERKRRMVLRYVREQRRGV